MTTVMICAAAIHVLIDHARFIDVDAAADFQIELALCNGCHPQPFDNTRSGWDFDAVTDTGTRFLVFPKPASNSQQVFIFSDIFGCASSAKEDSCVLLGANLLEGDVGFDGISFPFFCNCPARLHLMQHHLVTAFFRCRNHGLVTRFNQAVERIQRVNGFSGVANNDQDFGLRHSVSRNSVWDVVPDWPGIYCYFRDSK